MAKEIERKFLVRDATVLDGLTGCRMVQGYLGTEPATTRVRIAGDDAYITVKSRPTGISCGEWEYSIPRVDAEEMLALPDVCIVEKTRYKIPVGERVFEVDVFHGRHAGLVLAEVELPAVDALVAIPEWVGEEVSGRREYTNAYMALAGAGQG
jgi:CYTH domain-containing protein